MTGFDCIYIRRANAAGSRDVRTGAPNPIGPDTDTFTTNGRRWALRYPQGKEGTTFVVVTGYTTRRDFYLRFLRRRSASLTPSCYASVLSDLARIIS